MYRKTSGIYFFNVVAAHFKGKFRAQTLKKGESANLFCEAFGEKPINILWSKDRQPFDPSTDPR